MHTVSLPGVLAQEVLSRFLYFKYSRGTRCKKKKKWGVGMQWAKHILRIYMNVVNIFAHACLAG